MKNVEFCVGLFSEVHCGQSSTVNGCANELSVNSFNRKSKQLPRVE